MLYDECYNIGFWGLENFHPFDSKKFRRVLAILEERGVLAARQLVQAREATRAILAEVHSEAYLDKLHSSPLKVAMVRAGLQGGGCGDWHAWQGTAGALCQCGMGCSCQRLGSSAAVTPAPPHRARR